MPQTHIDSLSAQMYNIDADTVSVFNKQTYLISPNESGLTGKLQERKSKWQRKSYRQQEETS